jgi:hypothetical protein
MFNLNSSPRKCERGPHSTLPTLSLHNIRFSLWCLIFQRINSFSLSPNGSDMACIMDSGCINIYSVPALTSHLKQVGYIIPYFYYTATNTPLRPISIQENFPRTENFPKISLLKVENFQLQNFFPTENLCRPITFYKTVTFFYGNIFCSGKIPI